MGRRLFFAGAWAMLGLLRYFFDVQTSNQRYGDDGGTLLPDDMSALDYADRIINDIKSEKDYDHSGWSMVVRTARRVVFSLPF
jgi:hypothetical protein